MKIITTLVLILTAAVTLAQAPSAETVMKEAYVKAARGNKNVFLMFHASWCGWCRKLDTSLNDPTCKKFFEDNYVITHLVVNENRGKEYLENPGAAELKDANGGKDQGVPFWLIFDSSGNLLADSRMRQVGTEIAPGDNVGCPATEDEVLYFLSVLRKTSNMTREQLEIVQRRFRRNDD